ncbi:MAG: hypothetical protein H6737_23395 [Alphaproteobacteria bacterium]|nr:hypothetical protein [Alphaproteobacteria bacterium]
MIWMLCAAHAAAPTGWWAPDVDGYTVDRDETVAKDGSASAVIRGEKGAKDFATLLQPLDPAPWAGKRVRYTAWVRTEGVKDWAGAWMRVDVGDESTAFDNMQDRALRGTNDWTEVSVVLDVDAEATGLVFGILLSGPGAVWLDDVHVEEVPRTVEVTDLEKKKKRPTRPKNLDFEP